MQFNPATHIPVMEHFYTIQGEGFYTGHAAYFIRLAGCDVGCVWCDVKASWTAEAHQLLQIDELVQEVLKYPGRLVVITGGEPLMYDLSYLTLALKENGFQINIETSGAYPISGSIDWICVSPKKFKAPLKTVLAAANELKCIIFNRSDFDFAEQNRKSVNNDCKLYLQTEWSKKEQLLPLMIAYIKEHTEWNISTQTHKYLDIP
ncbi:MAG TPA: 7-carboxy-7-deazaguanine synthase QueE [Chitinophagales bacterium]|nr:7-carboxy-7-deazaguanine synthase QueE [Chitinophagales bacterium]HMW12688.1 7-carboxy-7-deazaguanine synthase QueE [Chitinophagales bacterium]HMX60269.1 7-carboxy-7-deazaguanine synthase QueE [Chitinophagales bacterium]HMY23023.1 7-carboxy-7-deazaguanine synthase QueE [Chitinophagales bacterium]HMZ34400.1 7-carboxy-7-deazaguanine synthase QueE [Chitinophagales bacterium]